MGYDETMKYVHTVLISLALLIMVAACGSKSDTAQFRQALRHDVEVGHSFGQLIVDNGHSSGTIIVLVNPDIGPRLREVERGRIEGLRKGLGGAASNLREVPIADKEDLRLLSLAEDDLPADLLAEVLAGQGNVAAVVSLIGFPRSAPPGSGIPPLYVFGVNSQHLAREAVESGWAKAVLYAKGVNDLPSKGWTGPMSASVLDTYGLEISL
ncbi:MAG: hypothetical protein JJU05_07055 [Verrucomicrobia bacterium]|nr:hypothetical protein [Verrucomicrobiota bacterium]MCH8526055.1 hypothetical protein [Kiritimatiellia bacterium]